MELFKLAILLLIANQASAQFTELSYRDGFSNYFNEFVRGSNGAFTVGSSYNNGSEDFIYQIDNDASFGIDNGNNILDVSIQNNGNLVVFATATGCDYIFQSPIYMVEMDQSGQVLNAVTFPVPWYEAHAYSPSPDSNYLYLHGMQILKVDYTGQVLFETDYLNADVLMEGWNGDLLAFTSSEEIRIYDSFGVTTDSLNLPERLKEGIRSPYETIFLSSDTAIYQMDSSLTLQDITTPLGLTSGIRDFLVDSSGVLLLHDDGIVYRIDTSLAIAGQVDLNAIMEADRLWMTDSGLFCSGILGDFGVIARIDSDLNVTSDVQIEWMEVRDLNVFDGELWIAGTESYNPHHNAPSALMKNFTASLSTYNWQNDVEISEIYSDSISSSISPNLIYTYAHPKVRVKNNGVEVLQDLEISYHYEPIEHGICEWYELGISFNGLNLSPLSDTVLALPKIPWITSISGPTDLTLCAYGYSPNNKMDVDHTNNKTCTTFSVNVSVDATEKISFDLYPNPVEDKLILETNETNTSINIIVTDMIGRTIPVEFYQTENRIIINTQKWHSGIYLMIIDNGRGSVTKKIIKQLHK